jgi:hypothetical protein
LLDSFRQRHPEASANLHFVDQFIGPGMGGVAAIDLEERFVFWGANCEAFAGVGKQDVIGKKPEDVFPPDLVISALAAIRTALAGTANVARYRRLAFPGQTTPRYYDAFYNPLRSPQGDIIGAAIAAFDITEEVLTQRRLSETQARFQSMADTSPVMLWMTCENGQSNFFNQTWLKFTGRPVELEFGLGWMESIHPDDLPRCTQVFEEHLQSRTPFELEYRLRRYDGEYRWVMDRASPRFNQKGRFVGFIGSCVDITDRKRALEELNLAKEAAVEANRAKSNFLSMISHEIRTPLGILLGFSELVLQPGQSQAELSQYVDGIKRNGRMIVSIINSILDLSKIEAGKLEVERQAVVLNQVVEDVSAILKLQADEKGVHFLLQSDWHDVIRIETDPLRLKQILVNVIGNAIKFTDQGRVEVQASIRDGHVWFRIEDTGLGMSAAQASLIFEPFTQADNSTTRRYGGTGLGLSLARKLARALGGDVMLLRTQLGEGSVFEVSIDPGEVRVESTALVEPATATETSNAVRGVRVFLVDDAIENRFLLKRFLENAGVIVECAVNGVEAVEKALATNDAFDLILMDISMPVMDGFEATRILRSRGYNKPIVALTAYALKEERERCLASGFTDHLSKPVTRSTLLQMVSRFVPSSIESSAAQAQVAN